MVPQGWMISLEWICGECDFSESLGGGSPLDWWGIMLLRMHHSVHDLGQQRSRWICAFQIRRLLRRMDIFIFFFRFDTLFSII